MAIAAQWSASPTDLQAAGLRASRQTGPVPLPEEQGMPNGIDDRNSDIWEALVTVADLAGGEWPERARVAAVALVTDSMAGQPSLGVQLLRDLRAIFAGHDRLTTDYALTAGDPAGSCSGHPCWGAEGVFFIDTTLAGLGKIGLGTWLRKVGDRLVQDDPNPERSTLDRMDGRALPAGALRAQTSSLPGKHGHDLRSRPGHGRTGNSRTRRSIEVSS